MILEEYGRRSGKESVLGMLTGRFWVFNAESLVVGKGLSPMAKFALAGDKLVGLALGRVFVLQLGEYVTSKGSGTQ